MIERRELAPVRPAQDVLVLPRRWGGGVLLGKLEVFLEIWEHQRDGSG